MTATIEPLRSLSSDELRQLSEQVQSRLIAQQAKINALETRIRELEQKLDRYRERFGELPD